MRPRVLASLFIACSCSVAGLDVPHEWPRDKPVTCRPSNALPIIDTVTVAGALGGLAYLAFVPPTNDGGFHPGEPEGRLFFEILSATVGTIYALSATDGYITNARCRRFHREASRSPAAE